MTGHFVQLAPDGTLARVVSKAAGLG